MAQFLPWTNGLATRIMVSAKYRRCLNERKQRQNWKFDETWLNTVAATDKHG